MASKTFSERNKINREKKKKKEKNRPKFRGKLFSRKSQSVFFKESTNSERKSPSMNFS